MLLLLKFRKLKRDGNMKSNPRNQKKQKNKIKSYQNGKIIIYFRYLSIAIIFFILGVLLGFHLNPLSTEKISLLLKSTSTTYDLLNLQFSFLLSNINNCSISKQFIEQLSNNVGEIGRTLAEFDKRKIKNEYYYFLKENYHLFQIKLYLLYKIYIDQCKPRENIILFFWGKNNESKIQGKILNEIVKEYKNVHVFAVEKGYSMAYRFLEEYYKVNITPSLIVNYNHIFYNITPKETIEQHLINKLHR